MGIIESTTSNGPVYCNIYLNLMLSLTDDNVLDGVMMNLDTKGYDFLPGSEIINIAYKIQFKVMNTLSPNAELVSTKGKTTIIETNLESTNVASNKTIPWECISFPDSWEQKAVVPPRSMNKNLEQIIQTPEGDIMVRFGPERLSRIRSIRSIHEPKIYESSRASTSSIPDKKGRPY